PDELPKDPTHPAWPGDDGLWVTAARVSDDGASVVLLLAEVLWRSDYHQPELALWAVVRVSPADGAVELLGRGQRAERQHFTITL
ncbi:MAG: hypothetical protein Q7T71_08755, partial [Herbiconiux sp.]|nr:hypothetical protein [Herbiconiux sp.]